MKIEHIVLAFALYLALATIVYRFKNPDYTDTQLLLHTVDILLLRD